MSLEAHHRFILDTMQRNQDIARKFIQELEEENVRLKADAQVILKHLDEASADCARLKAENERLRKADGWQPMETAPKDMSQILGYVEEYIVVMWWFTYSNGRACWETVDGESEVDPTHWMPLPKPPAV